MCSRWPQPAADGVDVRFEGADHGAYHLRPVLADTDQDDLTFVRALPLAQAADPAVGDPDRLRDERRTTAGPTTAPRSGSIVPHWYAVASVKWLKRIDVLTEPYTGEFQTGHYIYQWPDRPHEPVTLMRVRARITDPAPGAVLALGTCTRPRQGLVGHRPDHPASTSASPAKATGTRRSWSRPKGPYQWQDWSFAWDGTRRRDGTPCAPGRPTPPATSNPTSRRGTGSATATTPSRSSTSTGTDTPSRPPDDVTFGISRPGPSRG